MSVLFGCDCSLFNKFACRDDDFFGNMAVDAMLAVKTINARGEIKYPVKAVNVLKAHGKSATESQFVKGYALNCTVASQGSFVTLWIRLWLMSRGWASSNEETDQWS